MPLAIQLEIDKLVGNLWEEVKAKPTKELHKEVVDWVIDQGNTTGRTSAYDCMLMLYWVNMQLIGNSSVTQEAKMEGDEEPIHGWKEHNEE